MSERTGNSDNVLFSHIIPATMLRIAAARAFSHVLSLASKGLVTVQQTPNTFGPILITPV